MSGPMAEEGKRAAALLLKPVHFRRDSGTEVARLESMIAYFIAWFFGAAAGSAAACAASRYLGGGSLLHPLRSYCAACGKAIAWYDNVPVLSYLLLRGRCRSCKERIPPCIFFTELCCSLLSVFLLWRFSWSVTAVLLALFFWIAVSFCLIDLACLHLPDMFLVAAAVPLVILLLYGSPAPWPQPVLASMAGAGLLLVLRYAYFLVRHKEGLGLGDVKLVALLGLLTDLPGIFDILFMAALLGLAAVMLCRLFRGALPGQVPFGPFLCMAAYIKVLWGA